MSVYDTAHRLTRQIKESEEYTTYQQIRQKIMSNKKQLKMLQDYQKETMLIQSKQLTGADLSDQEKEQLQKLTEIIELNPVIKKYLEAEYRIGVMLNDINEILFDDLKLGIFMDNEEDEEEEEKEEKHPE